MEQGEWGNVWTFSMITVQHVFLNHFWGTQSAHVIQRSVSSQALQHFACVDSTCFILEAYGTIRFQTSSGQRLERFGGKRSKDISGLFIFYGVRSTFD